MRFSHDEKKEWYSYEVEFISMRVERRIAYEVERSTCRKFSEESSKLYNISIKMNKRIEWVILIGLICICRILSPSQNDWKDI